MIQQPNPLIYRVGYGRLAAVPSWHLEANAGLTANARTARAGGLDLTMILNMPTGLELARTVAVFHTAQTLCSQTTGRRRERIRMLRPSCPAFPRVREHRSGQDPRHLRAVGRDSLPPAAGRHPPCSAGSRHRALSPPRLRNAAGSDSNAQSDAAIAA